MSYDFCDIPSMKVTNCSPCLGCNSCGCSSCNGFETCNCSPCSQIDGQAWANYLLGNNNGRCNNSDDFRCRPRCGTIF